jgi:uncharacterized protein (TIGR01777 family)
MTPEPVPSAFAADRPSVAITGATGLIGSALVSRLRAGGTRVLRLMRRTSREATDDVVWDPMQRLLPRERLEGVDAIVHLAGAPIAQRWTAARKRGIRESRVRGTALIADTIAAMERKPRVLVSGSAVGYYGDRGDEQLDEHSAPGADFLAGVAGEWERATAPAADAGVRVVLMRTGVVLSPRGGALGKLLLPFRLGVGGRIGSGRQWMSWIALDDHLRAIEYALASTMLSGAVNFVAPNPVTNAEFATTLGRVLTRPAFVPVPRFALELIYGEMARATILAGQRVLPKALAHAGFEYAHPTLEQALRFELDA